MMNLDLIRCLSLDRLGPVPSVRRQLQCVDTRMSRHPSSQCSDKFSVEAGQVTGRPSARQTQYKPQQHGSYESLFCRLISQPPARVFPRTQGNVHTRFLYCSTGRRYWLFARQSVDACDPCELWPSPRWPRRVPQVGYLSPTCGPPPNRPRAAASAVDDTIISLMTNRRRQMPCHV